MADPVFDFAQPGFDVLVDKFVEPAAPSYTKRGFGAGVAGLKSSLYGAGALAARGVGSAAQAFGATGVAERAAGIEQAALENVEAQNELAAEQTQTLADVDWSSPSSVANHFKWLLGNALPTLGMMALGGAVGYGLGRLGARAAPSMAGVLPRAGAYAGAITPDVALEAGSIYPEALRTGVEDPALRALTGGALAASADFLPLLAAERYLRPLGRGGFGARLKGAVKGVPVGAALEGTQEAAQSFLERAFAGRSLGDAEAVDDYLNSFAGGAAPGTVFGAGIGARRAGAPTVQPVQNPPVPTNPEQAPVVGQEPAVAPVQESIASSPLTLAPIETPVGLVPIVTPQEEAWNTYNALEDQYTQAERASRDLAQKVEQSAIALEAMGRRVPPAAKAAHEAAIAAEKAARTTVATLEPKLRTALALAETPAELNPAIQDRGPTPESGVIATSATPPTEAQQIERAVTGIQEQMRERGLITEPADTTYRGNYDRVFGHPITPITNNVKETVVQPDVKAQMQAIEPHAMAVIEPMAKELAKAKSDKPDAQVKIANALVRALRGVVTEAAKKGSVEEAQAHILKAMPAALKGRGVMMDAPEIAKAVSVAVDQVRGITPSQRGAEPRLIGSGSIAHEPIVKARNPALDTTWATLSIAEQTAVAQEVGREQFELAVVDQLEGNGVAAKRFLAKASDIVRAAFRKVVAALMSIVVALHIANVREAGAIPRPAHPQIVQVQTIIEKPKATFNSGEHSAMSEVVANWVRATDANRGKSFIVADKAAGQLHAFMADGTLIRSAPALYGESLADAMTPEQLAKPLDKMTRADKITPAGRWNVTLQDSPEYGWVLSFKGGNGLAIHSVYLGTPSENRLGRLSSKISSDNYVSWGCINVPAEFAHNVLKDNFTSKDHGLFILPIQTENTYKSFGVMEEDLMPNVETEFRPVRAPGNMARRELPQGAIAESRSFGNAQGRIASTKRKGLNSRAAAALTPQEFDALPRAAKEAATDVYNRVMMSKGLALRDRLFQILGNDPNLTVKTFQANPDSPIGSYTRVNKLKSVIAMALNAKDGLGIADHEGFHYAEDRLLTGAERQIIANATKPGRPVFEKLMESVRAYDQRNNTKLAEEVASIPAEARAYAFEFWRRGELQAEGALARVFQVIRNFFEKVSNLVRGLGFTSIDDVFTALDRGQFAERTQNRYDRTQFGYDTLASKGPDQTQTEAFKRWFGDSKVVDAEGKPLVVYHGTIVWENPSERTGKLLGDVMVFNPLASTEIVGRQRSMDTVGIWTVPSSSAADMYAGKTGAVYPLYVNIAKPKIMTWEQFEALGQRLDKNWHKKDIRRGGKVIKYASAPGAFDGSLVAMELELQGYDGIKFPAIENVDGHNQDIWVAFKPIQIKSAIGNIGTFSLNNPDIRFSRAKGQRLEYSPEVKAAFTEWRRLVKANSPQQDAAFKTWRELKHAEDEARGQRWFGTTQFSQGAIDLDMERKVFADQARQFAAGELPQEQFFQAMTQMMDQASDQPIAGRTVASATASETVGLFHRARMPLATGNYIARFSKGYRNVMETMLAQVRYKQSLIAEGSEVGLSTWHAGNQVDRDLATDALMKRTVAGYLESSKEYKQLRELLTEHQQKMFDQANAQIAKFLNLQFEANKTTFQELMSEEEFAKWEVTRRAQVDALIANGYVPERRYGEHTVSIYADTVGKKGPQRIRVGLEHYEHKAAAIARAEQIKDELKAAGADLGVEVGERYRADYDSGISIRQFLDTARRHGVQLSQVERERLSRALVSADSIQRNRMMHRQNVPGYSKEGYRIMNEFVVAMANEVSRSTYSSVVNDALDGKPVTLTPALDGQTTAQADQTSEHNLWVQDGPQAGFYHNLADDLADRVLSPAEGSQFSSRFKGAAMAYFLGGSLSAGLVQMFALPMNTLPWLSNFTSYGNAFSASLAAMGTTLKNAGVLRDLSKLENPDIKIPGIDDGLRQALIQAAKDGRTMDTEIFQIMGISRGGYLAQSRTVQKAMDVWMSPFKFGEQTSRIASFIAAYKIGQANKLTGVELYRFAGSVVDNTQNQFNEVNRPAIASHPIWSLLFMFKSFPLFMVEMLELMYRQNPKSAVYMLLGLVGMTGIQGLPFAEDIEDIIDLVANKIFGSPFNTRKAMRNALKDASEALVGVDLSELFLRGAINDILGFNVTSRVGMGDLVPGTRIGSADMDYGRAVEQILGAPFSMLVQAGGQVGNLLGGVAKVDLDQITRALREGGPSAVRNLIKGAQQMSTGYAEDARGRKLADVPGFYAFWQMGGLSSAALQTAYELDKIDHQTSAFYTYVRSQMQDELVRALKNDNKEKADEVWGAMRKWDEAHPDMPLILNAATMRRQLVMAGIPLNQRTMMLLPRQLRGTSIAAEGIGSGQ